MNSQSSDSIKEFAKELANLVEGVESVIQKYGLDEYGLAIWNKLPAICRPSSIVGLECLRRFQSYEIARSERLTDGQKALVYLIWRPLGNEERAGIYIPLIIAAIVTFGIIYIGSL